MCNFRNEISKEIIMIEKFNFRNEIYIDILMCQPNKWKQDPSLPPVTLLNLVNLSYRINDGDFWLLIVCFKLNGTSAIVSLLS